MKNSLCIGLLVFVMLLIGVANAVAQSATPSQAELDQQIQQLQVQLAEIIRAKGQRHKEVFELEAKIGDLQAVKRLTQIAPEDPLNQPVTIDFKGGSIREYIAAVNSAAGLERAAAILSDETAQVPPFKLSGVSYASAFLLLNNVKLTRPDGREEVDVSVLTDSIVVRSYSVGSTKPQQFSRVWSIDMLLGTGAMQAEDVLSAVQAALALHQDKVEVRYHDGTGLIMARGTEQQMNAIDDVIATLVSNRRPAMKPDIVGKLDSQVTQLSAMSKAQMEALSLLKTQLSDLKDAFDKEAVARRALEAEVAKLRAELKR